MLVATHWGTGQVLWSIVWFFLFFVWIMLILTIFGDIVRSSMSGAAKALWAVLIIFLPFLGVFAYLVVHGGSMEDRRETRSRGGSPAGELSALADLHERGELSDDEYRAAKAKILDP